MPSLAIAPPGTDLELAVSFAFLLGLSFFLGFTYEGIFEHAKVRRPGGVRTFPMLALIGGVLYLLDPTHLIAFTVGLLVLGAWLAVYYCRHLNETDESGESNVGLMVLLLNVYAYLLGAIALGLPHWAAVGMTVAAVLLFTGREKLHDLARRIETKELVTAAQFLIMTGLVLPLLPNTPVTALTGITPRQAGLSIVVVSAISYASYLVQRYLAPTTGGLWTAALGGLYSSTATTVVLARQARSQPATLRQAQAGITLATGIMYLRVLIVVAAFNLSLAHALAAPLLVLFACGLAIAAAQYRFGPAGEENKKRLENRNPLELGPAVTFGLAFVVISVLSTWVKARYGMSGVYSLAAVVGIVDIDPFVLSLAQGGAAGLPSNALAAAILIATSSNNVLKAVYATAFAGWRTCLGSVGALAALALAGLGIAWVLAAAA